MRVCATFQTMRQNEHCHVAERLRAPLMLRSDVRDAADRDVSDTVSASPAIPRVVFAGEARIFRW